MRKNMHPTPGKVDPTQHFGQLKTQQIAQAIANKTKCKPGLSIHKYDATLHKYAMEMQPKQSIWKRKTSHSQLGNRSNSEDADVVGATAALGYLETRRVCGPSIRSQINQVRLIEYGVKSQRKAIAGVLMQS